MSREPLVSVIIPTYNRAALIAKTIDNVFQQTYRKFELIIVDDGSTDDTASVLRRYEDRARIITQRNAGPAVARNNGAKAARGEILAFQDSDDLWKPTKLERQIRLLEMDRSVPCCLCDVVMRTVDGKPFTSFDHSVVRLCDEEGTWVNVLDVLTTRFVLFNQAAAIRRNAFERVGGFSEKLRYLEDYDLPLRLSLEGPWMFIREPLVIYGEASPLSFSAEARRDPVLLRQCELAIYDALLTSGRVRGSARKNLQRRAKSALRHLAAAKLQGSQRRLDTMAAQLIVLADRYLQAIHRRSPRFPQPKTIPIAANQ